MKNKKVTAKIFFIILLLTSCIILSVQLAVINKSLISLESKTKSFEKTLAEFQIHQDLQIEKITCDTASLLENQEKNRDEIQESLSLIDRKSSMQFSKTVSMSRTYDELLEEQKKKTVDITKKDNAIQDMKNKAITEYNKKQYNTSYKLCSDILQYNEDDIAIRTLKLKSLYYKNPIDTASYTEILNDLEIILNTAFFDDECKTIKKTIEVERGIFHE